MQIHIPEFSLILLVGISGSGKSTFAKKYFLSTEIISSDACRGLVSDDENNQTATSDAFDLAEFIARKRLKNGLLTVIDATNIQPESRKKWIALAREYHAIPIAIVLNISEQICLERNKSRVDRSLSKHTLVQQYLQLKKSLRKLKDEGIRHITVLDAPEKIETITEIVRDPLYSNKKQETGPFDIIGDIHGCFDELIALLTQLGYHIENIGDDFKVTPPLGRKVIFLGDLVDRGPKVVPVLKLVMHMVAAGTALCVPGNHEEKLLKYLKGKNVQLKHGLEISVAQLTQESEAFRQEVAEFIYKLISHYVLDEGKLVVAHAGILEGMQGRGSGAIRAFCLYGETTGEIDTFGLPVRYNWAINYKGKSMVVYGHTPVPEVQWLNNTLNIDTGCVFGGKLTALRYPEREIISVKAFETYAEPIRPLIQQATNQISKPSHNLDLLDMEDVLGKQIISTRYASTVIIQEGQSAAALESISRFAIDPKWLIYLPPTMSPSETSEIPDLLEHPKEAFAYYQKNGIDQVICEEKHMGSRAILIICKDYEVVKKRFRINSNTANKIGIGYTRTGRNFFTNAQKELEQAFLTNVQDALTKANFWDEFATDWVCLDAELMPWSAKAQGLLKEQYAAVGTAATHALEEVLHTLKSTQNTLPLDELLATYTDKEAMAKAFVKSYQNYCWPVSSIEDYQLACFHILATEGKTYFDKNHLWHLENIQKIGLHAPKVFKNTAYQLINLKEEASIAQSITWWENMTAKGGEGMVIKPIQFLAKGNKGIVQPAIKVRGKEYLRIIYGPEYTSPTCIKALKKRGVNAKRNLAMREFLLSLEALERFVHHEPFTHVHQCVFGILALESEPIDPRL